MKLYETKKLHYNKYLYKLAVPNQCASYFRTEFQSDGQLGYARQKLDEVNRYFVPGKDVVEIPWGWKFLDTIPVAHYYDAIEIFRHLKNKKTEYKVRCESNILILYSNDRKFLIELSNKLRHRFIEFWEPDPKNISLLNQNANIILVNNPPKYEYKVTMGGKKGSSSLAKWIDNNPKLAKIGDVALEECYNNGYVKGYYFFVKDERSLTLVQMIVGNNIQRIDRMVYNDK